MHIYIYIYMASCQTDAYTKCKEKGYGYGGTPVVGRRPGRRSSAGRSSELPVASGLLAIWPSCSRWFQAGPGSVFEGLALGGPMPECCRFCRFT